MQRRARQGRFRGLCVVSQLAFGGSALDIQSRGSPLPFLPGFVTVPPAVCVTCQFSLASEASQQGRITRLMRQHQKPDCRHGQG